MNNEEKRPPRPYKIMIGDVVTIYRSDYKGKAYYKICKTKKNMDDTFTYGSKNVTFPKDVELENETRIRILDMYEDFYQKDKYTTIWTLFIKDFEIVDEIQAYGDYNLAIEDFSNEDLPF